MIFPANLLSDAKHYTQPSQPITRLILTKEPRSQNTTQFLSWLKHVIAGITKAATATQRMGVKHLLLPSQLPETHLVTICMIRRLAPPPPPLLGVL